MGGSLRLHPLVVLIGIIVGGSLAGILGMLLAAPVLATLRVLGRYVFYRLYDRDPFAEVEAEEPPPKPGLFQRLGKAALSRFQEGIMSSVRGKEKPGVESPDPDKTPEALA